MKIADLPANCASCIYHRPHAHDTTRLACHRHAPAPGDEAFVVAEWPSVLPGHRCGAGSQGADPEQHYVICARCVHWYHPEGGMPATSYYSEVWWSEREKDERETAAMMGLCLARAPVPGIERDKSDTHWRWTHAITGGCGNGVAMPADTAEKAAPPAPIPVASVP